jgi:hypothetical protein
MLVVTVLAVTSEPCTVRLPPTTETPPPLPPLRLCDTVSAARVRSAPVAWTAPPFWSSTGADPPVSVRPEIRAVGRTTPPEPVIDSTRLSPPASIARSFAPGPSISRLPDVPPTVVASSPPVSVMVPVTPLKVTVSSEGELAAASRAARRLPGPPSASVVTTIGGTAACAAPVSATVDPPTVASTATPATHHRARSPPPVERPPTRRRDWVPIAFLPHVPARTGVPRRRLSHSRGRFGRAHRRSRSTLAPAGGG